MPDASASSSSITSPQDRIAILEDLVAFHCDSNLRGAHAILRVVADLRSADMPHVCGDDLRAAIALAVSDLARVGRELAMGQFDEATQTALRRSPFVMTDAAMLS